MAAGFVAELIYAARLESELAQERRTAHAVRVALREEARAAQMRAAALESELGTAEDEAVQLYEVVRAMRTLAEQLRVAVGLAEPVIEPLPDLPPRVVRTWHPVRTEGAGDTGRGLPLEDGGARGGALPAGPAGAVPANAASPVALAGTLPPDTGPWAGLVPGSAAAPAGGAWRSPRMAAASEAIMRHWDVWQYLGQTIDQTLSQRRRVARPSIRPASGRITSRFGERPGFWGELAFHTGVDISLDIGTPVVATASGTVSHVGMRWGYGVTIEIEHADGLLTLYGHLSHPLVSPGQQVSQGQVIALSGNSGISSGPHLHYEVRLNGIPVDPRRYW